VHADTLARVTSTAQRHCYRHPDRETGLSCSECDRAICYECMTPAPVGLRCPEHSGKPVGVQKLVRPAQRAVTGAGSRRANAVTMALIATNMAVYALELATGGSINGTGNWLFTHGAAVLNGVYGGDSVLAVPPHTQLPSALQAVGFAHGDWWRLITPAFLHYGPLHLAINMYSLFYAGTFLESAIGRWRFALLYLVSGIAGVAGAFLWSPNAIGVGASGAIFGVLGALYVLERRGSIATGGQIAGLIVLNLVFTFALSSFISVGAHVGGLIGGVALMIVLLHFRRSAAMAVAACVGIAALSVALAYWKARGYT
jgi:membrane associated rhomboid family serine protease